MCYDLYQQPKKSVLAPKSLLVKFWALTFRSGTYLGCLKMFVALGVSGGEAEEKDCKESYQLSNTTSAIPMNKQYILSTVKFRSEARKRASLGIEPRTSSTLNPKEESCY